MLQLSRWKIILVVLSAVFGVLWALPNVLTPAQRDALPSWLPHKTLNLGLDLQGGSYLLLEVDTAALMREQTTNTIEDIRNALKTEGIAGSPGQVRGQIIVRVNDPEQMASAQRVVGRLADVSSGTPNFTVVRQDANTLRLQYADNAAAQQASRAVQQSIEIIRKRVDSEGTKEISISRQGATRIVLQAPGDSDPEALKRQIGQTAKLTFQMVDETVPVEEAQAGRVPPSSILLPQPDRPDEPYVLVRRRVLVSGESLSQASPGFDQNNRPSINFRFNGDGARRFGDATARNIGKRFAIILDGKVISAPVIQSAITGGSGQITGNFTVESATELSNLLNGGALPAPLKVIAQSKVGAGLGEEAVRAGQISLLIGAVAICIFMLIAYGLFGVFAIVGLLLNVLLLVATMTMFQFAMTLPGIAGIILTLAVAVDANVLIYERMRDEQRAGHRAIAAADHGFQRALVSIFDANVTSAISAIIMYSLGSGPVKGFALTLLIGVVTSVFTAIVVTQLLIGWWFRLAKPKSLPI
ncbi:MAG: protein translocase subunit SecD [Caulobacteraceae bacterium]|nr:protein translocase subunit SecD [Caulobacteraceae bacterium]